MALFFLSAGVETTWIEFHGCAVDVLGVCLLGVVCARGPRPLSFVGLNSVVEPWSGSLGIPRRATVVQDATLLSPQGLDVAALRASTSTASGTAEVALLLEVLGGEAGNLQAREVSSASPSTTLVLTRCFDR